MTFARRCRLAVLLSAAALPLGAYAEEPSTRPAEHADHADAGETFEHGMERANRAYQALKKSAFDAASRDADLTHAREMQEGLQQSKSVADEMPMMGPAEAKYGDDAAAYHRDLRAGLIGAQQASLKLEAAVNAGDAAAAKAAFAEVAETQRDGHRAFRPGRDNRGRPDRK